MLNFYEFYNKTGLDNEFYASSLYQLKSDDILGSYEPIKHIIKRIPEYAYWYAYSIIDGGWPEAEPYIMEDPYYAYWYARYVIEDRWIEAEKYIMKNSYWWSRYKDIFGI